MLITSPPWLPYVLPLIAFVGLTSLEGMLPSSAYPLAYMGKIFLVTLLALLCRTTWSDFRPKTGDLLPALLVGVFAWVLWVGLDLWPGYPHQGERKGFDPYSTLPDPVFRQIFIAVRFYGLVLLVPLIEELFWRSFLLRYASRPEDFQSVPLHGFTLMAALFTGFAFAAAHPEWLAAAFTAALYLLLLRQTKSLFACFVAHSVTNLCLGVYILITHHWVYW